MWLYGAGFNAWSQLRFCNGGITEDEEPAEPDDIAPFTCILQDDIIGNIWPFLSFTVVTTSKGQSVAGIPSNATDGNYIYSEALNDRVVVYDDDHVFQYASLKDFLGRKQTASPTCTIFPVSGVIQTVAYDTGFAALTSNGQVWTWGDGRFPQCLGRPATEDSPADRPSRVTCLEDLPTGPIVKLAAGGYVLAALTRGRDMYCWGGYPGRTPVLEGLTGEPSPVVVMLEAEETSGGDVDIDIADVGLGEAHMIVLTADGHVCVVGDNANGQLGLPLSRTRVEAWVQIDLSLSAGQRVKSVAAGPRSSFIVVDEA